MQNHRLLSIVQHVLIKPFCSQAEDLVGLKILYKSILITMQMMLVEKDDYVMADRSTLGVFGDMIGLRLKPRTGQHLEALDKIWNYIVISRPG